MVSDWGGLLLENLLLNLLKYGALEDDKLTCFSIKVIVDSLDLSCPSK